MAVTVEINGKSVTFDVEEREDGVALKATHIDGKQSYAGYLLHVTADGRYFREGNVNPDFGFKLNDEYQIKRDKEKDKN